MGEVSCAVAGELGFLEAAGELGAVLRVFLREGEVAEDGGEDVVEIVGDAAGEYADGFEFVGALHLLFEAVALGDIAQDEDGAGDFSGGVFDRGAAAFDEEGAVGAEGEPGVSGKRQRGAGVEDFLEARSDRRSVFVEQGADGVEWLSDDAGFVAVEELGGGLVDEAHDAGLIEREHALGHGT